MLNFGIVGCGHIAKKHGAAIEQIEGAKLAAVCDVDASRTLPFRDQYGATGYSDYNNFLKHQPLDAVIICTPSGLHFELGEKAALTGKHVLIEKPYVLNCCHGKVLADICRERGVQLGVVHPNRTKPVAAALKKALDEGWFGTITHVSAAIRWNRNQEYFRSAPWRGTRLMDGGILFNQAIHNLDLFHWLTGPVTEVFAYGATRVHNIESEDICVCSAKLESGALGLIEAAVTLYPCNLEETLAVFGSHGTAVLGGTTLSKIKEWRFSHLNQEEALHQAQMINGASEQGGHLIIIQDFVSSVINGHPPLVSGKEAQKTICLVNSIYRSMESHRPEPVRYF